MDLALVIITLHSTNPDSHQIELLKSGIFRDNDSRTLDFLVHRRDDAMRMLINLIFGGVIISLPIDAKAINYQVNNTSRLSNLSS